MFCVTPTHYNFIYLDCRRRKSYQICVFVWTQPIPSISIHVQIKFGALSIYRHPFFFAVADRQTYLTSEYLEESVKIPAHNHITIIRIIQKFFERLRLIFLFEYSNN